MSMRILSVILAVFLPAIAAAEDAPPGALACTGCHDPSAKTALSLEGMTAEEIAAAVADIRSGAREATLMNRVAAGFTDAEIEAIAQWLTREDSP
jgi:cytochrome c553